MLPESYQLHEHETTPGFLVARVVPSLSRSCRLHVDLPLLGMLTWLCGGARNPRRFIPSRVLYRRLLAAFPLLRSLGPRQLDASLGRLWRSGLAKPDDHGQWAPCWSDIGTVCRIDTALWARPDLSPAAKRVHSIVAHRVQRGRQDAAVFLASVTGSSRGRIGEALGELVEAGVIERSGGREAGPNGSWPRLVVPSTGTQPKRTTQGVGNAAPPKTRVGTERSRYAVNGPGTRTPWAERVTAAGTMGSVRDVLRAAGVGASSQPMTSAGRAGLAGMVNRMASEFETRGTGAEIVAAWLLEQEARGLTPSRACAALVAATGRSRTSKRPPIELDAFVHRTRALRHLPTWRQSSEKIGRAVSMALPVAGGCATNVRHATQLRIELDRMDAAWKVAPLDERERSRGKFMAARTWLLSEIERWTRSATSCTGTAG